MILDAEFDEGCGPPTQSVGHRRSGVASPAYIRDLSREDLDRCIAARTGTTGPKTNRIKAASDRHHRAAKLCSLGRSDVDVAAVTGYTPTRIRQLKADPAFKELIAHYATQSDALSADLAEQVASTARAATAELSRRLEETPEQFSIKDLQGTVSLGHSPTQKSVVASLNVDDLLADLKARASAERRGMVKIST